MTINLDGTFTTALWRAFISAAIAGALAGATAYQTTEDTRASVTTGVVAFLSIMSTRGGFEGLADRSRQISGEVKSADVQGVGAGQK